MSLLQRISDRTKNFMSVGFKYNLENVIFAPIPANLEGTQLTRERKHRQLVEGKKRKKKKVIRELHPSTSKSLSLRATPDNTKVKGNKFLFPILSDKERNVEVVEAVVVVLRSGEQVLGFQVCQSTMKCGCFTSSSSSN